jgi:hypothetical protein
VTHDRAVVGLGLVEEALDRRGPAIARTTFVRQRAAQAPSVHGRVALVAIRTPWTALAVAVSVTVATLGDAGVAPLARSGFGVRNAAGPN